MLVEEKNNDDCLSPIGHFLVTITILYPELMVFSLEWNRSRPVFLWIKRTLWKRMDNYIFVLTVCGMKESNRENPREEHCLKSDSR